MGRWIITYTRSLHSLGQFRVTNPPPDMSLGDERKPENLEETDRENPVPFPGYKRPGLGVSYPASLQTLPPETCMKPELLQEQLESVINRAHNSEDAKSQAESGEEKAEEPIVCNPTDLFGAITARGTLKFNEGMS